MTQSPDFCETEFKANTPPKKQKTVNLALQGGGAHGAFAWGVLDKILEDGRIDIEGICATSAGTMNACALAYGKQKGGPEGARKALHDFWWKVHVSGQGHNPVKATFWERIMDWNMDNSVLHYMFDSMTRVVSPYQFNPFDINPLRDIVEELFDFKVLQECDCVKLFISATHVQTGRVKVFETKDVNLDVVMASACLPYIFKAVNIKGEDYWDGGYMGNPALYPLFYETDIRDVIIVHINPLERKETPTTSPDIMNRINEISFNSSLIKEMRAIAFVKKLIRDDMLKDEYKDNFTDVLVHSIRADEALEEQSVASKFNSDWDFLTMLRDKGRETMDAWLKKHFDDIGKRDTVDVEKEYLKSTSEKIAERRARNKKKG